MIAWHYKIFGVGLYHVFLIEGHDILLNGKDHGKGILMGFTTQTFLFIFLPVCMLVYYSLYFLSTRGKLGHLVRKYRLIELALIALSCGFYAWACFDDVLRLCIFILAVYIFGKLIALSKEKAYALELVGAEEPGLLHRKLLPISKIVQFVGVTVVVYYLIFEKYWDAVIGGWNWMFSCEIPSHSIVPPLGISFLTFSAISYLVDISRGAAKAGNLIDCALYLSFFPKVISGPTVLWRDFQTQIPGGKITLDRCVEGVDRIMIGFAKKLILADTFGACIARMPSPEIDRAAAWGAALLYMLQLYYDFSGYSDIAIGLAKLLGFDFKENFRFPYLSKSVTEFWRRWHISLGTWFREYVYFPLGGSQRGMKNTLRNLAIVFLLTGIWHGNGLNYLLWGGINGFFVVLERLVREKPLYKKTPDWAKWLCTMAITLLCWQLFRFNQMEEFSQWGSNAFLGVRNPVIPYTWNHYFDKQIIILTAVGALGSTLFGLKRVQDAYQRIISTKLGHAVYEIVLLALFVASILFMVNSTYHPFIYFQY